MQSLKKNEFSGKCPVFYNEVHTEQSADLNLHAFTKQMEGRDVTVV